MNTPQGTKLVGVRLFLQPSIMFAPDEVECVILSVPTASGGHIPCAPVLVTKKGGQRSEWFGATFEVITEDTRIIRPE